MSTLSPNRRALTAFEQSLVRLAAHDMYDRGGFGSRGALFDGSVYWSTVYNPQGSGNDRLIRNDTGKQALVFAIQNDIRDDGQLNGSFLRDVFSYGYTVSTGHNLSNQFRQIRVGGYTPTWQGINAQAPNPFTPDGFDQISKNVGVSPIDNLWLTMWGHDAITGKGIDGDTLTRAFNDPNSIDFRTIRIKPEFAQATQGLIDQDIQRFGRLTGDTLNEVFLRAMTQASGVRFI